MAGTLRGAAHPRSPRLTSSAWLALDVSNEPPLEEPMRPAVAEPGRLSAVEAHPR
jgi:hypothetical protein